MEEEDLEEMFLKLPRQPSGLIFVASGLRFR